MKKSQVIGQIFIYILAIILIAFVLGYGYKTIAAFRQKTDQVSFIKFKNELQNAVKTITTDFGSVKIKEFQVPGNYNKICFVRSHESFPASSSIPSNYPIIRDSVDSDVEKNVFLVKNIAKDSFYIGKIKVVTTDLNYIPTGLYCVDVKNTMIKLRLEGKGNHVVISEAS